jgi:hypothetical protein
MKDVLAIELIYIIKLQYGQLSQAETKLVSEI